MKKWNKALIKKSEKYSIATDLCSLLKFFMYGASIFVGVATKSLWATLGLTAGSFALGTIGQVHFTKKYNNEKKNEDFKEFYSEACLTDSNVEKEEI